MMMPPDNDRLLDTTMAVRLQMSGMLQLIVQQGEGADREYNITHTTVVGNDPAADIYVNDPLICPRHARIVKEGNWWKIKDLKSENGTFVNGRLVAVSPLFPDSEILLGNTRMTVSYTESPKIETAMIRRSGEWFQLPGIIAHELKNYLQFFDAGLEQLKQDSEVSDRFGGEIKSLEMAGEKMDDLVQMLRAGCAKPRISNVDIVEIIWEQIALFERSAQNAGISLDVDLPIEPVFIYADANQMGRCILNVIKNAMEACSKNGLIGISLPVVTEHRVKLCVRDTGHGMNPQTLEAMWSPLFTTRSNGNGLGAFIARTAVLQHKGSIQAQSEPGKGTVIHIELPRRQT